MAFHEPGGDGLIHVIELAGEEVIRVLHKREARISGNLGDKRFHFLPSAVFVLGALHDEFGFGATFQIREVRTVHGNSQTDQFVDAFVRATHAQPDPTSKTEAADEQRSARKFLREEINGSLYVSAFTQSAVVCPSAQARTAKIETQHGNAESIDGFRGLIHDFVVQSPAKQRMRMAEYRRDAGCTGASGSPENSFELPSGPSQKEIARIVMNLHKKIANP